MPISNGGYAAPTWQNGGAPAINADELNAISTTLEYNDARNYHKNLLDNAWFMVNTPGRTHYDLIEEYMMDRWWLLDGDVTLTGNGAELEPGTTMTQHLEDAVMDALEGENVTLSIMLTDGELVEGTLEYSASSSAYFFEGQGTVGLSAYLEDGTINISTTDYTADILCVKLEAGSYSTLERDKKPEYREELLRCVLSTADLKDPTSGKTLGTHMPVRLIGTTAIAGGSGITGEKYPFSSAENDVLGLWDSLFPTTIGSYEGMRRIKYTAYVELSASGTGSTVRVELCPNSHAWGKVSHMSPIAGGSTKLCTVTTPWIDVGGNIGGVRVFGDGTAKVHWLDIEWQ